MTDQALTTAGMGAQQVDTIVASANGSVRKDAIELQALGKKFSAAPVNVTGFKHVLGETLGASGAFSAALACLGFGHSQCLPAVAAELPTTGGLRFSTGAESIGDSVLIADLGYRGDSAALLLTRY